LGIQTSEFPLLISLVLEFLLIYYRTSGLQKLALKNVSLSITPRNKDCHLREEWEVSFDQGQRHPTV